MPNARHQKLLIREFIGAFLIWLILSFLIVKMDFFDWWYEYTRAHEHWELDEIATVIAAALITGSILAIRHIFIMKTLMDELEEANLHIKEQSKLEAQRAKLAALGQMSSGLAHEINNALQPATGLGDFVIKELKAKKSDKQRQYMEHIMEGVNHTQNLIRNILDFSQDNGTQTQRLPAAEALLMAIDFAKTLTHSTIAFDIQIDDAVKNKDIKLKCNATQLSQIFINLFKNASTAMGENGTITVKIQKDTMMPDSKDTPAISIAISDTGQGMDEETRAKIFDPFFTTKDISEGTGLGLSVVFGIVQNYNGTITVESKQGHGSTFHIMIPVAQ